MIYALRHRTTYSYEEVVTFARCVLRLTPRTSATQTVLRSSITVTPKPANVLKSRGPFGEQMLRVLIDRPHRDLVIESLCRIDVHTREPTNPATSEAWEAVRTQSYRSRQLGADGPAEYLYPTPRALIAPMVTEYARTSFPPGRAIIEAVADLMTRIHADFTYDPEATDVSTPVSEAFESRHGVCQDFAHIMIAGLRGLGLPAAYVSGYLRTIPPAGQPRLAGADATHAWVSVWCGENAGWIGFDPTNAVLARNDHIILAIGRDYSDVAPIDGVILAPGEQKIKVEVDVVPQDETLAPDLSAAS